MKWDQFVCSAFVITALSFSSAVIAYDEPIVNLGYTSFLDGSPPAGPGLYFQNYLQYYTANRFNDDKGERLPLPRTHLDATAEVIQLIYLSKLKIFGATLGVSALLPWLAHVNVDDGSNNNVLNAQEGPSDLFIGPALQFDPIMINNKPFFVQRFELDIMAPVGRYNSNVAINPGNNFLSLNPYWAATLWFSPQWTLAYRLHYLWNFKNNNPNVAFGPEAYSTQAGEAFFGDIAAAYGINEQLHVGVNSYFFYQTTDTKVNEVDRPGRREKVWAIGPGMLWGLAKNQFLFFNLYFEQGVRNRPQGTNFILRYVLHFE